MEHQSEAFDQLAKALAAGMPRRELLRQVVGGLSAAILASLGLGDAWAQGGPPCPAGHIRCGGECVDPRIDPQNCGRCGNVCDAGTVCIDRRCGGGPSSGCLDGQIRCSGGCVDPSSDPTNCGGCGIACDASQTCCAGRCADRQSDVNHCGGCGVRCSAGQFCQDGRCVTQTCLENPAACPTGTNCCCVEFGNDPDGIRYCVSAVCVDFQSDPNHCGDCRRQCASGQTCVGGTCTCATGSDCAALRRTTAADCCGGLCQDIGSTASRCGGCGIACAAGEFCYFGVCYCGNTGRCPPGQTCATRIVNGKSDRFCG